MLSHVKQSQRSAGSSSSTAPPSSSMLGKINRLLPAAGAPVRALHGMQKALSGAGTRTHTHTVALLPGRLTSCAVGADQRQSMGTDATAIKPAGRQLLQKWCGSNTTTAQNPTRMQYMRTRTTPEDQHKAAGAQASRVKCRTHTASEWLSDTRTCVLLPAAL